jgi:hypothetical protein
MEDMDVLMASNRVNSCPCPVVVLKRTVSDEVVVRFTAANRVEVWVLRATRLDVRPSLVLRSCSVTALLNVERVDIVTYREEIVEICVSV